MAESLLSVGLDVGTTTTQLILSRLVAENRASSFAVPKMEITGRDVIYESAIHFTPLLSAELVDGEQIRHIVEREYALAGIKREDVDTGAIIITGETSRKENAAAVLAALSDFAGDFVVATAGPDLESLLAAKGAGAVEYARQTGKRVLHMDIGGGTSNLCCCEGERILYTACLNVGGRLVKLDGDGKITYLSPQLQGLVSCRVGQELQRPQAEEIAGMLARVLEVAAGLREPFDAYYKLITHGTQPPPAAGECVISFSGGVADCIEKQLPWREFGDIGPLLGQAIRASALCRGVYRLGSQTIRATVIGAGCHSTQLSGSTVFLQNVKLPMKNLPVAVLTEQEQNHPQGCISRKLAALEGVGVLAMPGWQSPDYSRICALADAICQELGDRPCYLALQEDMAKALGHALALRLKKGTPCLCIDGIYIPPDSYLDVGAAVGSAISVVVKTLILSH